MITNQSKNTNIMSTNQFSSDESRKIALLIARVWADPSLESQYKDAASAVLAGAGVTLGDRDAPVIPDKPMALAARGLAAASATSSASSLSTITCPCTGCTASSAGCLTGEGNFELLPERQINAMMKLADDPKGRESMRKLTSAWGLNINLSQQ